PAVLWVLNTMARKVADSSQHIPIPDPAVRSWLGLSPGQMVFSMREGTPKVANETVLKELIQLEKQPRHTLSKTDVQKLLFAQRFRERFARASEISKHLNGPNDPTLARVYRIENDQVLNMLGLKRREGLRYCYTEIEQSEAFGEFVERARNANRR